MDAAVQQQIDVIIGQMKCPKAFQCAENGFAALCKAKDVGMDGLLECLEENPALCKFAIPFGRVHYCECPLRTFLARKLGR